MATANPFDLLGDGDIDDVAALVKTAPVAKEKHAAKKPSNAHVQTAASGNLPVKPLPPSQAVREARASQSEGSRGRGGSGRGGRGNRDQEFGRGRGGNFNGDRGFNQESYDGYGGRGGFYEGNASFRPRRQEDGEVDSGERGRGGGGGRGGGRGGRGGRGYGGGRGFGGDAGDEDHRKRIYDRRSGTGRGSEMKREGSGRGNWGTPVDEGDFHEMEEPTSAEEEKILTLEKAEGEKNVEVPPVNEEKKQEEEDEKEMTLDEYEKLLEEKRKKLLGGQKVEERKVDATAFESMKQLSIKKKKDEDAVFIKVSEKDKEKKIDAGERDDRIKKPISINEFLKPAEGERYYGGGRGRGRGRGNRGGFTGGFGGGDNALQSEAPKIEDHGQFPTLGGK